IAALLTFISGVRIQPRYHVAHALRQNHCRGSRVNRKYPCVAGYGPVEFVVVFEETKLAISAVGEFIGVNARRQQVSGASKINALAAAVVFVMVGLSFAVSHERLNGKRL